MRTSRLGWQEYFLGVAWAVSERADCRRRAVGAVVASPDNVLLGTGYNGTRPGAPGCLEGSCPRGLLDYDEAAAFSDYNDPSSPGFCISTHAEVNAMRYAGWADVAGSTVYVTCQPCPGCRKFLVNSEVYRLVYGSAANGIVTEILS